jgi:hypothetical protein
MAYRRSVCQSDVDEQQHDVAMSRQNDVIDRLEEQREVASVRNQREYMSDVNARSDVSEDGHVQESAPQQPKCNMEMEDRYNFGYVSMFTIEDPLPGKEPQKQAVPRVAFYHNRGVHFRHFNRMEYDALVQVRPKPTDPTKVRSVCFDFNERFVLAARYTQKLKGKQSTLIFKGRAPRHPGEKPNNQELMLNWQKQADQFAEYILTMFRPEYNDLEMDNTTLSTVSYNWQALQEWISNCQCDASIINKFRLMAVDKRMNGLHSPFANKAIVSDYRFRAQDQWTDAQNGYFDQGDHLDLMARSNDMEVLGDEEFAAENTRLSLRVEGSVQKMLNDDAKFNRAMLRAYGDNETNDIALVSQVQPSFESIAYRAAVDVDLDETSSNVYDENYDGNGSVEDCATVLLDEGTSDNERHGATGNQVQLNTGQTTVFLVYKNYLENPTNTNLRPPAVVLVTGKGGTGKSLLINAIIDHGKQHNHVPMGTAFNNLNACDIGGFTISKLLGDGFQKKNNSKSKRKAGSGMPNPIKSWAIIALQKLGDIKQIPLLIIDEISNVPLYSLARLSKLFAAARERTTEPFGGMPILLVGDFNQKKPTGGELATMDLLKFVVERQKGTKSLQNPSLGQHSHAVYSESDTNACSDRSSGCQILAQSRWFELTEAERSKDKNHNVMVDRLYAGESIGPVHLKGLYKLWDRETLKHDNEQDQLAWANASVICKTNRERHTLTHVRAIEFGKVTGTVVIRWKVNYRNWEAMPQDDGFLSQALQDPAFFEYFVVNAKAILTATICRKKKLCNGTQGTYHSLILSDTMETYLKEHVRLASAGDVITLPDPPIGINIIIANQTIYNDMMSWKNLSLEHDRIVITIRKHGFAQSAPKIPGKPVPIHSPSLLVNPSRVIVEPLFPVQPCFAITVDKAQGQTIQRVIVALSERELRLVNFTYSCVTVAFSRVEEAQHLRILLKKEANAALEWDTLTYISFLKRDSSVGSFFAGFSVDRNNWITDVWDEGRAVAKMPKKFK